MSIQMLRSVSIRGCRPASLAPFLYPAPVPTTVIRPNELTSSLCLQAIRRFSSFSDSDADEIWREMQALKKEQNNNKQHSTQHELRQHLSRHQHTADADTDTHTDTDTDSIDTLHTDGDSITSSHSTLVHRTSSATSLSSHPAPVFRPTGGPSVDAILRMRRTNRKVDTDDISNRFQKAMEYKRMRQQQKEAEENAGKGKAGQR